MTKHIEMVSRRGGNGIDNLYRRVHIKDIKKNRFYLKELINEVRLCKVLCKNCHAIETENNREFHNSRKKTNKVSYIFAIRASPNSEHFTRLAPFIKRSKS